MWITLDSADPLPLNQQIYMQIKRMILNRSLAAGSRLPSTRQLSSDLSVSRNTVIDAYSQLIAEGYLKTYKGSGTVVSENLHALETAILSKQVGNKKEEKSAASKDIIDFRTGIPALDYFPRREWGTLYRNICDSIPSSALSYTSAMGVWELRETIAAYLYRTRGMSCDPAQILITSGSTQGLSLVSHVLRDSQKVVLVENPSHAGLRNVIASAGCSLAAHPADEQGLCTHLLGTQKQPVSFLYCTPSHQYPLGGILPIQRRLELLRFVEQQDCYIVEDDYDSEFRYEGRPVSSLYELNPQRVIYLASFSKLLAPALRLGFMVLPEKLAAPCKKQKIYSDVHTDVLSQYTLSRFIQNGSFERYIWKMKKHYSRNRSLMIRELSEHFSGQFHVSGHASGLHMVIRFPNKFFTAETINKLAEQGVFVYRTDHFYLKPHSPHNNEILLGYSHLSPEKIIRGIGAISRVLL